MTANERCKLCEEEKVLQKSHIIPGFTYKWLKASSVTGHLRFGETPNKRVQDGHKLLLLCGDCEQLFCNWENTFAKKVFNPLHNGESINSYGPWLLKFSTSVSWRVLTLFKNYLDLNHFPNHLLLSVEKALNIWKEFLLNKQPHPAEYEQHMLPFRGFIEDSNDPELPSNFNQYVSRSIDVDAACNKTEAFIYVKMCRILLIGFIAMDHPNDWRDTKIHVNQGILEKKHYKIPGTIRSFMYYKAKKGQKVLRSMSKRQWDRIGQDYEKNPEKFRDSEMFHAITCDSKMFGDQAFDDVKR